MNEETKKTKKKKSLLKKLLLTFISLVVTLLIAEFMVRIIAPQPIMPRFVESAPWGIRKNIPFSEGIHDTEEFKYVIHTNSQGFRSKEEYDLEPREGSFRIVTLGDSHTLGLGVADDKTFCALLQKLLREKGVDGEVINMGVSGFGTAEELIQFRHVGKKHNPDMVILTYFQNDQTNNVTSDLFRLEKGELVESSGSYQPGTYIRDRLHSIPFYSFFAQHSHLLAFVRNFLSKAIVSRRIEKNFTEEVDTDFIRTSANEQSRELTQHILNLMIEEVTSSGMKLLIMNITHTRDDHYTNFPSDLELNDLTFVLDTTPYLKKAFERGETVFYEMDGHPTEKGHEVLANAILENLVRISPELFENIPEPEGEK